MKILAFDAPVIRVEHEDRIIGEIEHAHAHREISFPALIPGQRQEKNIPICTKRAHPYPHGLFEMNRTDSSILWISTKGIGKVIFFKVFSIDIIFSFFSTQRKYFTTWK